MNNYQYCAEFAISLASGGPLKVLDYGCGAGQTVQILRNHGLDAFGCDVFYSGGDYSEAVPLSLRDAVRRMDGVAVPFDPESFDLVINNQVMEHVESLDGTLAEIHRVLRPGGVLLSLFPDYTVWREGHCGIPLLHRFPKFSSLRIYYAAALRCLGLGYNVEGKSIMQWSRDFCVWLDRWTYYRRYDDIAAAYGKLFEEIRHIESDWFDARATRGSLISRLLPDVFKQVAVRRLAGLVFICRKAPDSGG